ncbi:MAG: hypothetical protein N2Z76_04835 [Treponemataceae bacterium]|nr:hypothetical protein [Treponemataceae bacterium]
MYHRTFRRDVVLPLVIGMVLLVVGILSWYLLLPMRRASMKEALQHLLKEKGYSYTLENEIPWPGVFKAYELSKNHHILVVFPVLYEGRIFLYGKVVSGEGVFVDTCLLFHHDTAMALPPERLLYVYEHRIVYYLRKLGAIQ